VLHTGTEIHTIAHFGRRIPAVLRTALHLGAPPDFNGTVCAAPGCDRCYHLQWDHIDPVANGGPTSYLNYQALCPPSHRIKTAHDRKAGLLNGTKKPRPRGPDPKKTGPNRDESRPRLM
jgi:5-methylcytosine-specific restriction endonuclease McrA